MKEFYVPYFEDYKNLAFSDEIYGTLDSFKSLALQVKNVDAKLIFAGNGASAAISAHAAVDFTKQAKVRGITFNEADLITCFANDYGFEHWVEKAIDFYGDEGDSLILISAGGNSPNMTNGAKYARKKKIKTIITFTGNDKNNDLTKLGDINFWVNSKAYNHIENVHQILLLSLVDLIIGKTEYSP